MMLTRPTLIRCGSLKKRRRRLRFSPASLAMMMLAARVRQIGPTGKSAKTCPAPAKKIFRLTRRANQRYLLAPSHPMRGALRNVTNARWDAVDAEACEDERS
jgi:hypothetical protein